LQKHYKSGNKAIIKKIEKILIELSETPFSGEANRNNLSMTTAATDPGESIKKTG
jgi:toxin YoeB